MKELTVISSQFAEWLQDEKGTVNGKNCKLGLMGCRTDGRGPIRVKELYIGVNRLQDRWPGTHSGEEAVHWG